MIIRVVDAAKTLGSRQNIFPYLALCRLGSGHQIGFIALRKLSAFSNSKFSNKVLANDFLSRSNINGKNAFSISKFAFSSKSNTTAQEDKPAGGGGGGQDKTPQETTTLEIDTKSGKLLVKTTTTADAKLQEVIIEKPKTAAESDGQLKVLTLTDDEKLRKAEADLKEQLAEKNRQLAKKRIRVDFSRSSLERNFITPVRAMSDFLLKPSDLEALPKTKRRSPYEQEPPITVYWRKDVEAKAIGVWGSRENLLKECLKREIEKKRHQQNIFTVKRRLRDYRREIGSRTNVVDSEPGLFGKSGKVVLTAIAIITLVHVLS